MISLKGDCKGGLVDVEQKTITTQATAELPAASSVELYVVKRTGELVAFDTTRIINAVQRAARATGVTVEPAIFHRLIQDIVSEIESRFIDLYPNVENIQDIIEKNLMKYELFEVSKSYILYRAERARAREEKKKEDMEKTLLGKLKITKRDGRTVIFDIARIEETLKRAASGREKDISFSLITKELIKNVYDGITTFELEKALLLATTAFIEKDPAYSYVGARLYLQKIYKEVIGTSITKTALDHAYKESFVHGIMKAVELGILDTAMANFDLKKLAEALNPERDHLFQYIGLQTLYERYFLKSEDQRLECPQSFWMRVAMGLAIAEKPEERTAWAIRFYDSISTYRFVPSTPTLFHSGTVHPQLSSCYLNTVTDDLSHIFKVYSDNAQLSKWSGGIGTDWTNIRATGAHIKSTNVESQGVIPFLKIANDVTAAINRSGKRRGATCTYLETWHLDIEDFLDLRKNTGDDRRRTHDMNTANWIPDLFMKRMLANEDWTLFSPEEVPELHELYGKAFEEKYLSYEARAKRGDIKKYKTVSALKLWRKMISMLFETGHPWITFKDPANIRSPQDHAGVIHNSNLCTEITLNTSQDETAVCNLGSINLEKHVVQDPETNTRVRAFIIDKPLLAETIALAVRMLDNVIDINYYPTTEARNANLRHRPIGLGIMGVQDAFFKLNLAFDDPLAFASTDETMEFIAYQAILTSSHLAKERGSYASFAGSKWSRNILPQDTIALLEHERGVTIDLPRQEHLDWGEVRESIKKHGMRNSNVMAVAPTATISTIVACFPTIEPIYKNIYVKSNMSGEFTVVNSYLVEDLKGLGLWGDEMLSQLKYYDGNISMIAGIPDYLKAKYKEAFEIDPQVLIRHTALRAKWIDQSQSHNIFIKGTSGKIISDTYIYAWQMGLKTTYYLRTLAASQIEKSTLDAKKYGFTQKREYAAETPEPIPIPEPAIPAPALVVAPPIIHVASGVKLCKIENPDCEACQ